MPGKSRLKIGVFIDWVYSEFQQKLLYGIMEYYKGLPADIFCFPTGSLECPDAWDRKKNILFDFVGDDNFDGLIILTDPLQCVVGRNKFSRFLKKYGNIPIVSMALRLDGHYSVEIDNRSGMIPLLDHLIIKHHFERIAFITGPEGSVESADRLSAFMEYFKSHNLPVDPNLIVVGNFTAPSGKQAVKTLLDERKVTFDCIFASDDEMAIGAIEELSSRGIRVPGDAFIAGFDDVSASLNASLTTVRQPIFELGRKSAEILYAVLSGKKVESRTFLPTALAVRESCGCNLQQLLDSSVWKKDMEITEDFYESFTKYSEKIINEMIA
ncbi:MAG: LacI family DNA-binding transcriptional regulator, partial [Brevinematales bacterium]